MVKRPTEIDHARPLLTLPQAAKLLHTSARTLLQMVQLKKIPAFRVGYQWRISASELAKWIQEQENAAQKPRPHRQNRAGPSET